MYPSNDRRPQRWQRGHYWIGRGVVGLRARHGAPRRSLFMVTGSRASADHAPINGPRSRRSSRSRRRTLQAPPDPPPPLPEQKRIAAILDAADALRTKRRESLEQLDELLQSVFLDMFGDPVTNPKGWERGVRLGDVGRTIASRRLRRRRHTPRWKSARRGTIPGGRVCPGRQIGSTHWRLSAPPKLEISGYDAQVR